MTPDRAGPAEWVLLFDVDDPPPANDLVESVWNYGLARLAADPLTGGAGCHGADYNRRLGVFRRYEDDELRGDLRVSVVPGAALPMYRCRTIRTIGGFDHDLFVGFEEGEYGLRINHAGLNLYVDGATALRSRRLWGQDGRRSGDVKTIQSKAAWRRYYSVRNSTQLARRYAGRLAPLYTALGGAAKGTIALLRRRRPLQEVILPARGAVDGLVGRVGRRVDPGRNEKAR